MATPTTQGMIEQTLADLVRVADSVDVHSNPRVAHFAGRLRDQIAELRRSHEVGRLHYLALHMKRCHVHMEWLCDMQLWMPEYLQVVRGSHTAGVHPASLPRSALVAHPQAG
jgi:hypothetical protein